MKNKKHSIFFLCLTMSMMWMFLFSSCKKEKASETVDEPQETPTGVTPVGHMETESSNGPFIFHTHGGGIVYVNLTNQPVISFSHDSMPTFSYQFWSHDPTTQAMYFYHENLNGKHIKDKLMAVRTIVFPDGAKVTMTASGQYDSAVVSISIYDEGESHRIDVTQRLLVHSSTDATTAQQMEAAELDGEAGSFMFTETGLLFFNDYTEETLGVIIPDHYLLGELFWDDSSHVNDYFDDPRYGST